MWVNIHETAYGGSTEGDKRLLALHPSPLAVQHALAGCVTQNAAGPWKRPFVGVEADGPVTVVQWCEVAMAWKRRRCNYVAMGAGALSGNW